MSTNPEVTVLDQTAITGDEIAAIANVVEETLVGQNRQAAIAALIALAILNIRNDYQGENLGNAITEVSTFISMLTTPVVDGEVVDAVSSAN